MVEGPQSYARNPAGSGARAASGAFRKVRWQNLAAGRAGNLAIRTPMAGSPV